MLPCRQLEVGAPDPERPWTSSLYIFLFLPFWSFMCQGCGRCGCSSSSDLFDPLTSESTFLSPSRLYSAFYDTGARKLLLQTTLKTMAMATAMATGTNNGNEYGLSCLQTWCTAVWSKPLMAKQVSRWILFYWECAPRRCLQFIGSDDDASRSYWRLSPVVRFIELFWLIVIWVGPFLGFFRSLFWPFLCHFSWQF